VRHGNGNAISNVNAVATGTAAWFRLLKSDATTVLFDGTVGLSASDLIMTDVSLTTGEACSVSSFTVTNPE
jgi:hypothetical protein